MIKKITLSIVLLGVGIKNSASATAPRPTTPVNHSQQDVSLKTPPNQKELYARAKERAQKDMSNARRSFSPTARVLLFPTN